VVVRSYQTVFGVDQSFNKLDKNINNLLLNQTKSGIQPHFSPLSPSSALSFLNQHKK